MNKFRYIFIFSILLVNFFSIDFIFAQEESPLGKLSQDYILRLNQELKDSNQNIPSQSQQTIIVNPEIVLQDAIIESIDTISHLSDEFNTFKENNKKEFKGEIKRYIDEFIAQIKDEEDVSVREILLQVDDERVNIFNDIDNTIDEMSIFNIESTIDSLDILEKNIITLFENFDSDLKEKTEIQIDTEKINISFSQKISLIKEFLNEIQDKIYSRQGQFISIDSDSDLLSDYDEMYIYKTDPQKNSTIGSSTIDGEKIKLGINPLSESEEKIKVVDPRDDVKAFVSSSYKVDKIEYVDQGKIIFEGTALPNTYITIFIYSLGVIDRVHVDINGHWNYVLDKKIENGEHQIYIATIDSVGNILVRSNSILFTKIDNRVVLGIVDVFDPMYTTKNFIKDNFIIISILFISIIFIVILTILSKHKSIKIVISELKREIH